MLTGLGRVDQVAVLVDLPMVVTLRCFSWSYRGGHDQSGRWLNRCGEFLVVFCRTFTPIDSNFNYYINLFFVKNIQVDVRQYDI